MHATRFNAGSPLSVRTRSRRRLFNLAMQVLGSWSYAEIEVPLLAPLAELRSALGQQRANELFRFPGRDGELLVLRGDVTPLIAWQYANHLQSRLLPVRVSYSKRLARVQREFAREQIESYQLGAELIGASGVRSELEMLTVLFDLIDTIGVEGGELRLGHVGITRGVVGDATTDEAVQMELLEAIERKDRYRVDELCNEHGIDGKHCSSMRRLCAVVPDFFDLSYLADRHGGVVRESADELIELFDGLEALGFRERVQLDLSRRDHRGYYTGLIFSVVSEAADTPLGGGGRYDNLLGHFGHDVPAIGFGLSADRIVALMERVDAVVMEENEVFNSDGTDVEAVRAALEARQRGQLVCVASHSVEVNEDDKA